MRRTPIFFWDAAGGLAEIQEISAVMAEELGWDKEKTSSEVENYRKRVSEHLF